MDATTQLANDVHFLTAPLRFIWRSILTFLFLFFAPAILLVVPLLVVHYFPGDDTIGLLRVLLGVLGPFAASFWFLICGEFPKFYATARDGGHVNGGIGFHLKAIGKMVFGFMVSAASAVYAGAPRYRFYRIGLAVVHRDVPRSVQPDLPSVGMAAAQECLS
jgi:hypothetical protein